MKKLLYVTVVSVLSLVVSCATTPSIATMRTDIEGFQLPVLPSEGSSMVYVIRPQSLGALIGFKVYVDQKETKYFVGSTLGGQYIYFEVTPGSHIIFSQAENTAEIELNADAGKVYFLEQIPSMGILFARNDLSAAQDTKGKYWVKRLKRGQLKS